MPLYLSKGLLLVIPCWLHQLKKALSLLNEAHIVLFPRGRGFTVLRLELTVAGNSLYISGYSLYKLHSL